MGDGCSSVKERSKLFRALTRQARMAVDEMAFEDLASEDGVRTIMSRLKEYFLPGLEVFLESAVYGAPRQAKEGFAEYVARVDKSFTRLSKEGVDLPDSAQGYIMYRQSALPEAQDQRFLVWCDGKLDKVIKDGKGRSSYVTEEIYGSFVGEDSLRATRETATRTRTTRTSLKGT